MTRFSRLTTKDSSISAPTVDRSASAVFGVSRFKHFNQKRLTILVAVLILLGACFLYNAVLTSDRFGAYHDDGIYVATAKALASGQGYHIISLPYEPAQTKYPPFYPFVLALIWKAYPQFPQNLMPMMLLSVITTLGFVTLTWWYLVDHEYATRRQALVVLAMTALNWRTMILATSVYSEMLFAFLAVAALHFAEKHERTSSALRTGIFAGVLIGLAFLTRSSGIALLISVIVYYAIRRQWEKAVLPIIIASLFVVGWIAWCYVNKTTAQHENVPYYTSYIGHLNQVISGLQTQSGSSRFGVLFSMAVENFVGGILISVPLVTSGLSYNAFAGLSGYTLGAALVSAFLCLVLIATGFGRSLGRRIRLLHIYIVMNLGLYLFWLPNVSYDRFLMPMLPFLQLFLVCELGVLLSLALKGMRSREPARRISGAFLALASMLVGGITVYGYVSGTYSSVVSLQTSSARAADDAKAISWLKEHSDSSETLVCYRDPKYFLLTGHKAVRSFPMTEGFSWEDDQASMDKLARAVFRIIDEANARYVVVTPTDFELEDRPEQRRKIFDKLIEQHPGNFVLAFESADGRSRVYRFEESAN